MPYTIPYTMFSCHHRKFLTQTLISFAFVPFHLLILCIINACKDGAIYKTDDFIFRKRIIRENKSD